MKVVAIEKGYYRKRRYKGDVFNVHYGLAQVKKSQWMVPYGTPMPEERVVPTSRSTRMVDAIKGIPADDAPQTLSEAQVAELARQAEVAPAEAAVEPQRRGPGRSHLAG